MIMKIVVIVLLSIILLLAGCKALTMSPDTWLDPCRWDVVEEEKLKNNNSVYKKYEGK